MRKFRFCLPTLLLLVLLLLPALALAESSEFTMNPPVFGSTVISGTCTPGATFVILIDDGGSYMQRPFTADTSKGTWEYDFSTHFGPFKSSLMITVTEIVNEIETASVSHKTPTQPEPPTLVTPAFGATQLSGTCIPGAEISIQLTYPDVPGSQQLYVLENDTKQGIWTIDLSGNPGPLPGGTRIIISQYVNNVGSQYRTYTMPDKPEPPTLDTPVIGASQLSGTCIPGAEINGEIIGEPIVNFSVIAANTQSGAWSVYVPGLEAGTSISVYQKVINVPSDSITFDLTSAPHPPTDLQATPDSKQVSLTWTAPAYTGDSPIKEYQITVQGTSINKTATTTSALIDSLKNGREYTLEVRAVNQNNHTSEPATIPATLPITKPDAPTNLRAEPGDREATLYWDDPEDDGGILITKFTISNGGNNYEVLYQSQTPHSYTVPNLKNLQAYVFTITAENMIGTSEPAFFPAVTPDVVPEAPAVKDPVPGDREVLLSWDPIITHGSAVTYIYVSEKTGKIDEISLLPNASELPVKNLTNGVEYNFQLRATNSKGSSPSSTFDPVVPNTDPNPPQNPTATPGDKTATLTWEASEFQTGDGTVDGYEVTSDGTTWTDANGNLSHTFDPLTNGTKYTLGVRAYNNRTYTNHFESAIVYATSVIPNTNPDAPTNLIATAGNKTVTLTWQAPTTGDGTIDGYEVTKDGGTTWTDIGNILSHTFDTLTNGQPYTLGVKAYNNKAYTNPGESAPVYAAQPVIPNASPDSPQNLTATAGNQSATLTWQPPTTGDGTIDGYKVSSDGGVTWTDIGNILSHTFDTLTNGQPYTLGVRAYNSKEDSTPAYAAPPVIPNIAPNAPQNPQATAANAAATLTWQPPIDNGGTIDRYEVSSDGGATWTTANGTLQHAFTGLTNSQAYTLWVRACNNMGNSPAVSAGPVAPAATPGMPQNARAASGHTTATLTWEAPSGDGGSAILGYRVSANGALWQDLPAAAREHTFKDLQNGTAYTLYVKAFTAAGDGPAATATATPRYVPAAPELVRPTVRDGVLLGTAEPAAAVTITISGTAHTTAADASGNWQFTLPVPLTLTDTITAYQTVGGVDGPATAPITPLPASDDTDLGINEVYENDPFITGECEAGAQVYLVFGGSARLITPYHTVGAGALAQMPGTPANVVGTRWYYNVSGMSLRAGNTVTAIQILGGETKNITRTILADRNGYLPPTIINPPAPGDTQITGTAVPGATITITDPGGDPIGTVDVDWTGEWTYPLPAPVADDDVYLVTQTVGPLTSAPAPAAPSAASGGSTAASAFEAPPSGYGVITGSRVNARERPALDATVLTQLSQGTRVRIVDWGMSGDDGSGPWCKITVGDQMYFVHNDYVDGTAPF